MEEANLDSVASIKSTANPPASVNAGNDNALPQHRISQFEWEGHIYRLRQTVACSVRYEDGWIYECDRYGLQAFAANKDETFAPFNEEFAFLYEGLVDERDEGLTADAIELKRRILEDVITVS